MRTHFTQFPTAFFAVADEEKIGSDYSVYNIRESELIEKLVRDLVIERGIRGRNIGIISSYSGQVKLIQNKIETLWSETNNTNHKESLKEITTATVNTYQVKNSTRYY